MTDLINRGRHRAIPCHFQLGLAGKDDKEQVVVGFQLIDPEDADCGRFITAFLFLSDGAFDRSIESLRYCGWEGDDLSELPGLIDSGWQPQEVELVVDHEEWDGKVQAKVKWINKPGGGAIKLKKPLEGDQLKRFAAQMKGRIRAAGSNPRPTGQKPKPAPAGGSQGALPASTHPNAPGNGVDDDIPFASCDIGHEPSPIARVLR